MAMRSENIFYLVFMCLCTFEARKIRTICHKHFHTKLLLIFTNALKALYPAYVTECRLSVRMKFIPVKILLSSSEVNQKRQILRVFRIQMILPVTFQVIIMTKQSVR